MVLVLVRRPSRRRNPTGVAFSTTPKPSSRELCYRPADLKISSNDTMAVDVSEVRKRILIGLFSDDELLDRLVLKGGNALEVIHALADRATVDMDFSMEGRFEDVQDAWSRIERALQREFGRVGLVVFDLTVKEKPSVRRPGAPTWWGGYLVHFKLVDRGVYSEFEGDLETIRRRAEVVGPEQKKTYKIDISVHEFCAAKERRELDYYTVYVYSLEMIVVEKLRAICQQMDSYDVNSRKAPRSRDFFDICYIMESQELDLTRQENVQLARNIFAAKEVPMKLLKDIDSYREFHRSDWESVELSISGSVRPFDYYFDYVLDLVRSLELPWEI